ncbi:MAG: DUF6974 family protein [Paracoccaceae bacterium]
MTTQDFASAKDMELFEHRWEKMSKGYYPLLRKGEMIRHSNLKVCNKISEHKYVHIVEYKSKESFEKCQNIWKKIENELFQGLLVKMLSDKGLVISETDLTESG